MSPGITNRFVRSSASAPGGAGVRSAGPTAAMRLPSTTMTASRIGAGATPSKSVPQRIARILISPLLRAPSIRGAPSRAAPDSAGRLGHQGELRVLVGRRDEIALFGRGEPALRAQREPLERHERRGLANPPLELRPALQRSVLGRHEPEHDGPVVGYVLQRLEAAGARVVVFQEEAREPGRAEDLGGDRVVADAAEELALIVAATQ